MTLVLTAINVASVVHASDRLTTKFRGRTLLGDHDALANKTIIYLAADGPMVIGFAGHAYVGDEPTDEWIVRQLVGQLPDRMPDGRIPALSFPRVKTLTFNQAVWQLQKAIEREARLLKTPGIEIAIGGWRIRRRRLAQTLLGVFGNDEGVVRQGHMRLRTGVSNSALLSIGVVPDLDEMKAAMAAHPDPRALFLDPKARSELLAETIVRTHSRDKTVGADVMVVEIPRWRPEGPYRVTIRYRPGVTRHAALVGKTTVATFPAAFWPWIVAPVGIRSPTISSGGSGSIVEFCGWDFLHETPVERPVGGTLFAESSLERPRPPR